MSNVTEVSKSGEIENGTMKEISVNGHEILLARVDDQYYATGNRCPHMGGKLSQGKLEGTVVTCPKHNSQFDLKDGRVVRWLKGSGFVSAIGKALKSPRPLVTYNVKIQDDKILIEI
jgi:3-phenylpropionate/trans-cinnamate dioxygenase ferredoxin subunit